ncbi:MAG: glycoside hydrolase family 13 protein [Actinomycetota bacterium]|nr:glycoside hydrolase family 13 protein [Actinomycetota bacterium]
MSPARPDRSWWRDAVFYQVYVRSFSDSDGNGIGDLAGVRARLPYLRDLGVDALWLTPFYPSPMADHGYDVADPRGVDPLFGDLADFDALVSDAHQIGLRVTVDIVPNHSSDRHEWFRAALAAGPGSPERDRYLFRDGRGPGGAGAPNNWESVFGGPAWTRVPDGQWYLHLFAPEQPDLNWRNPEIGADHERTLRFWLDRGVDGFRIDVAHGLLKDPALRDNPEPALVGMFAADPAVQFTWDQPDVHAVYRRWRLVLDSYPGERMAVGEVWVYDDEALARYVRPDELSMAFNFRLLRADWSAAELRDAIDHSIAAMSGVGAPATWVLSNHDVTRHVTRYGGGALGEARARAAVMLMLALPGPAYVYQGEELGLPEVDLPDEVLQDPIWTRSGRAERGRDGCRVPMPWIGSEPPYGFAPAGTPTWLPMPAGWEGYTVAAQDGDPASTLELYRRSLRLRHDLPALAEAALAWLPASEGALVFARGDVVCAVNLSADPLELPAGELLLCSKSLVDGGLPTDAAAWLRRS